MSEAEDINQVLIADVEVRRQSEEWRRLWEALEMALEKREQYWRGVKEDPQGMATMLMTAMAEVRTAIREVLNEKED